MPDALPPCRRKVCGHAAERHLHFRDGEDCGQCGRDRCPDYLGPTMRARLREWWRRDR